MIILKSVFVTMIAAATPLLLASLGGVLSQRSGVNNIGIEGMILMGAFAAMAGSYYTGNAWLGLICAILVGGLMGLIHAFVTVSCGGNQNVSSAGLILMAAGLSSYFLRAMFDRAGNSDQVAYLPQTTILKDIPVIGGFLSNFSPFVYIAFIMAIVIWYLLYKTPLGLRIKTAGENPEVAETVGLNVWALRYGCVIASGSLAGIAGAYLSIGQMNVFQEGMSSGRGFLALAAVIMGRWCPQGVVLSSLFFGLFSAIASQIQMTPSIDINVNFIQMVPYISALLVLALSSGTSRAPAACGKPYLKNR